MVVEKAESVRIIIEAADHAEATEALRSAFNLHESDYRDCIYETPRGTTIWAKRTKTGVSSRVLPKEG